MLWSNVSFEAKVLSSFISGVVVNLVLAGEPW
jgi:hypothetical protein